MLSFLLASLVLMSSFGQAQTSSSSDPIEEKLQVGTFKLEWAPVSGATSYSLRFISEEDKSEVYKFDSTEPELQNQIPQGRYSFQIRSIDNDGPGPWSAPIKINVERIDSLNLLPEDKTVINFQSGKSEDYVKFEWMPVPHASYYYFMINGRNGYKKRVKTRETQLTLPLKRGVTYSWKTLPIQKNGVIHETQGKPFDFYIRGNQLATPVISKEIPPHFSHIKWASVEGAQAYSFKLYKRPLLENEWSLVVELRQKSETFQLDRQLAPGEYKVEVKALSKWSPHSESESKTFTVKPTLTSLLQKSPADSQ